MCWDDRESLVRKGNDNVGGRSLRGLASRPACHSTAGRMTVSSNALQKRIFLGDMLGESMGGPLLESTGSSVVQFYLDPRYKECNYEVTVIKRPGNIVQLL